MKPKRKKYPTWDLYTVTPDKKEDLHFTVQASVSVSDERSVGLSAHEVFIDVDTTTVWIDPVEGYDTEELKQYVTELLEGDKRADFEQEIIEKSCDYEESDYYDRCAYEVDVMLGK